MDLTYTQYDVEYKQFTEDSDLYWTNNATGHVYSTAGFYLKFHRKIYASLFNMFLPSLLIVCTSFIRLQFCYLIWVLIWHWQITKLSPFSLLTGFGESAVVVPQHKEGDCIRTSALVHQHQKILCL